MENNIKRMYCFDCAILGGLAAILVFIITYVLFSLGNVEGVGAVRLAVIVAGMLVLAFALMGMTTVILHLKKNSEVLYSGDIEIEKIQINMEKSEGEAV